MAFNSKNLTIDFSKLRKIPVRDRATIAGSMMGSEIFGNLSPIDIAKLFPSYYKEKLNAMAGEVSQFDGGLSTVKFGGGSYPAGATGGGKGGGSGTATPAVPARPGYVEDLIKEGGGTVGQINQSPFFTTIMESEGTDPETTAKRGFANPFDVVLGYGAYGVPDKPLTDMTISEVYQFQRNVMLPNKHNSSAVGAFQIVSRNIVGEDGELTEFMKRAGLSMNDKFDENAQRRLAWEIYQEQGLGAWEGLKKRPDLWQKAQQEAEQVRIDEIESATDGVTKNIGGTGPIDPYQPTSDASISDLRQPFDPAMLDQLDPRLKQFYGKATDAEKRAIERAIEKLGISGVEDVMKKYPNVSADAIGDRFSVIGGNVEEVDPRLSNLIRLSSNDLPEGYTVKAISGKDARATGTRNHPNGLAMDVQIYDDKGEVLPHNRNSPHWKEYEKLYRSMYIRGKELYPDQEFIWGGAWISDAAGRGDPMHYQIVDRSVPFSSKTSGRYSFESGLDPSHPFVAEGGQLTPEERADFDASVRKRMLEEKEKLLKGTQPVTATPAPTDTTIGDLKQPEGVPSSTPAATPPAVPAIAPVEEPVVEEPVVKTKKLGGTDVVPNSVNENIRIIDAQGRETQVNEREKAEIDQNKINVKSADKVKTEETKSKTETQQQPTSSMKIVSKSQPRNNYAQEAAEGTFPHSPSYARAIGRTMNDHFAGYQGQDPSVA